MTCACGKKEKRGAPKEFFLTGRKHLIKSIDADRRKIFALVKAIILKVLIKLFDKNKDSILVIPALCVKRTYYTINKPEFRRSKQQLIDNT